MRDYYFSDYYEALRTQHRVALHGYVHVVLVDEPSILESKFVWVSFLLQRFDQAGAVQIVWSFLTTAVSWSYSQTSAKTSVRRSLYGWIAHARMLNGLEHAAMEDYGVILAESLDVWL